MPRAAVPLCTLASTPRQPEHCIEYASIVEWPRVFGDSKKLDNDDPEHVTWLYEVASKRAAEYNIQGVTWSLTQGVIKNIVRRALQRVDTWLSLRCLTDPRNRIYKRHCSRSKLQRSIQDCHLVRWPDEQLHVRRHCFLLCWHAVLICVCRTYSGTEGVYTYTFEYQQRPECPVCGGEVTEMEEAGDQTLEDFIEKLKARPSVYARIQIYLMRKTLTVSHSQLKNPALSINGKPLYWPAPADIEASTRDNLQKKLSELFTGAEDVTVTDKALPMVLNLRIKPM